MQGLYRQTCTDSGNLIRSPQPTCNWSPPLAPFHQSWIYIIGKKHSGKAYQLTLASGGSLCVNMSGFCSDSHKYEMLSTVSEISPRLTIEMRFWGYVTFKPMKLYNGLQLGSRSRTTALMLNISIL